MNRRLATADRNHVRLVLAGVPAALGIRTGEADISSPQSVVRDAAIPVDRRGNSEWQLLAASRPSALRHIHSKAGRSGAKRDKRRAC